MLNADDKLQLENKFPELKIKLEQPTVDNTYITISNLKGNKNLELLLGDNEDFDSVNSLPLTELIFLEDFIGIYYENQLEIAIRGIDNISRGRLFSFERNNKEIKITMSFKQKKIEAILSTMEQTYISRIQTLLSTNGRRSSSPTLIIKNITEKDLSEIRKLLNCISFDLNFNFGIMVDSVDYNPQFGLFKRPRKMPEYNELTLTYKTYQPELIEYYKIAKQMTYLPFKYLCYFHIIEFFMDKSSYLEAKEKLKYIISRPDFHYNMDEYISNVVNNLKEEVANNIIIKSSTL
ncbi:hypothetical protein BKP35_18190 [Anaerobacillus arseniciselenatis]|uniref:Uncharacterized protein n=1 Tax=Anaerobacillus arseniciselenatis TaxID=85682 RepID=A0A1S2L556_9BACI|nr:hypothetical protein [Anaerobacillus arseniciselenatis]OIJ07618.1 hypothetical protein BKP35_18190 [Anaerobacillus arseniciselenatis]